MPTELRLAGIEKRFGAVRALRGADLEVRRGEVHALVGENGSGKTTLMRILEGDLRPDAGAIALDGHPSAFSAPADARAAGIGVVYQEPNLAPDLTVAENVLMGRLPRRGGLVDRGETLRRTAVLLAEAGIDLDPRRRVARLSPDQRQLVEIARVVTARPWLVALDEPTASLTGDQVDSLFALLRRLRADGCAIIYISHRLREVFALCDRVTVLRDGETRRTVRVDEVDEDEVIRLMVGRELAAVQRTRAEPGPPALEVRSLSRGAVLTDVSLEVRAGEVVGVAGLVGAGRSALIRTLFGLRRPDAGQVLVGGREVLLRTPRAAIAHGLGLVPEDRHALGLCLELSIRENIALTQYGCSGLAGVVRRGRDGRRASQLVRDLAIRAPGPETRTGDLSGGNQQKVVLARWLVHQPRVLILDEPTRGIDVGAKAEIYGLLDDLAQRGVALLVSSSELPELLALCDRIYAMYQGRLVAHFERDEATEESVARAIAGADAIAA